MNKIESNKYPFISVLMAVRNTARFLPQAIESVLAETYSNFEFLIYDDASTDDSSKIIDQYVKQDTRIRAYRGEQKAPSFAYISKFLISKSKGEYFTISDSDDICLPDRMQCLVNEAIKNPSASIIFGRHRMVDEKCVNTLETFGEPVWPFKYFVGGFVAVGASLIAKKYYKMTDGYDDTLRWSADRDMCFKMLEQSPFSYIEKVVYIYRRHMASWTFERPSDYDVLSIIGQKTVKRNIPLVQHYLDKGVQNITYSEYIALSYVVAHLVIEILEQRRNDPDMVDRVAKKLGFTYESFLSLTHNISVPQVRTLDQLRDVIIKHIEKLESEHACGKMQMNTSNIYFLSPDVNVPCGGIKQFYRQVDILNNNGFNASVIHSEKNFRCTWFENNTKISYLSETELGESDYLVVPEIYGELFSTTKEIGGLNRQLKEFIGRSINRVIFNQNCYLTFNGYSIATNEANPFWKSDSIIATMVVSEDSRTYLQYVFPDMEVFRIHNSVDPTCFSYQHKKKKQICFMPRKLRDDVTQVVTILKLRNILGDFELVSIENRTEQEVAEIMKESLIFLSFSYQEGCALPPIEAMMCGCLVIGYDGRGGQEYFNDEFSYRIDRGDIIGFARTVEDVICRYRTDQTVFDTQRQRASEYVRKMYSPEKEAEDILRCWTKITSESNFQRHKNMIKNFNMKQNTTAAESTTITPTIGKMVRKTFKALYFALTDFAEFRVRYSIFLQTRRKSEAVSAAKATNKHRPSATAHKYCVGKGIEIGGSAHNPFGLDTLNVDYTDSMDTVFKKEEEHICGEALMVDIVAPGDNIPLPDATKDFVISSHVFEHFNNPIKALLEWDRLIKVGGIIFMIVPHKERTFDKPYPRTSIEHIVNDYQTGNTRPHENSHGHDHVWITEDVVEIIRWIMENCGVQWEIAEVQDVDDKVGNGFTIVIRKIGVRGNSR